MTRPATATAPVQAASLADRTRQVLSVYGVILPAPVKGLIFELAQVVTELQSDVQRLKGSR